MLCHFAAVTTYEFSKDYERLMHLMYDGYTPIGVEGLSAGGHVKLVWYCMDKG